MGNLSNLYISESYQGLINLADSAAGITSQSNYELQDGLGQSIGISILSGSVFVDNDISSSTLNGIGNVEEYSQSVDLRLDEVEATASDHDGRVDAIELYTSSLKEAFSVSGTNVDFNGDVTISGSLTAYTIHTITESASVIFSSGSNKLGDEPSDVQIFSGSVYVPNLHYLAGNSLDTNLRINQKLNTSSFDSFSSSVEQQLQEIVQDALPSTWTGSVYIPFSGSVDTRLDALELFSQSIVLDTASFQLWTGSVFDPFSASVDLRLDNVESSVTSINSKTGSYAVTSSNTFVGPSNIFSGSVTLDSANLGFSPLTVNVGGTNVLVVRENEPSSSDVNVEINDFVLIKGDEPKLIVEQPVSAYKSKFTELDGSGLTINGNDISNAKLTASYGPYIQFKDTDDIDLYIGHYQQMSDFLPFDRVSGFTYGRLAFNNIRNVIGIVEVPNNLFGTIQIGNLLDDIYVTGSLLSIYQDTIITGSLSVYNSASIDGGWAVTGSSYYSGSVKGNVIFDSSSTSNPNDYTHSIDCNLGNFFDFYLLNGENRIEAVNMSGGETITVRLNQPGGTGSYGDVVWDTGSIKFPFTNNPQTTQGSEAIDILTLVSFDTGALFGVLGKNYL
jgi:hypothetical protein